MTAVLQWVFAKQLVLAGHHCFNEMDYAVITNSSYEAITQGDGRWNSPSGDPEVGRLTIMLPADD